MSSLISIIVPIYKTESYLRKCLKSIVNQTYKNLEIILIEDGSPDNCGRICDEYAELDSRIKVIHQHNGGLSVARNSGLKIASGEYIGFVDSDDWIADDMFETLYSGTSEYHADIAICGFYFVKDENYKEVKEENIVLCGREEALHHLLLDQTFTNHVWNKLYKRELFEGITYPCGRTFEDIATTYKLFERAKRIVFMNSSKYYYLQRNDSIVGAATIDGAADRCILMYQRYKDLIERYPKENEFLFGWFSAAFSDFGYAVSKQTKDYLHHYKNHFREIIDFAIRNRHEVWKNKFVGKACKLNYTLFLYENSLAFWGIRFFTLLSRWKSKLSYANRSNKNYVQSVDCNES